MMDITRNNKITLLYKGFIGSIELNKEDGTLFGKVLGIPDSITYKGDNIDDLKQDFEDEIDDFISICEEFKRPLPKSVK